jgi:hypothetical protein
MIWIMDQHGVRPVPAKNIRVQLLKTNEKRREVIAIVTATDIHPHTQKRAARITLEVRLEAIANENPRNTSRRAKEDALLYLELYDE